MALIIWTYLDFWIKSKISERAKNLPWKLILWIFKDCGCNGVLGSLMGKLREKGGFYKMSFDR